MAKKDAVEHGGRRLGAGRPKTSDRDDVSVKIDRKVVNKARFVAEENGLSLAEYLSVLLQSVVDRDFAKASAGGEGGSAK